MFMPDCKVLYVVPKLSKGSYVSYKIDKGYQNSKKSQYASSAPNIPNKKKENLP